MAQTKLDIIIAVQDKVSSELSRLGSTLGTLESRLGAQDAASKKSKLSIDGLTGSVFKANVAFAAVSAAAGLATNAIGAVFDFGAQAISSAAAYQQNAIAFETLLGSASKAKTLLKQVSDFAAKTPFELPEVVMASKQLLAYGFAAEEIIPNFKILGDITALIGKERLPQLMLAFGQVKTATRLTGEELRQFTESGVPLLDELAKNMGVSNAEMAKMITTGQVGFPQVQAALAGLTAEGGRFYQGMEKQSTTFNGVLSNLRDNFNQMAMEIIGISQDGTIREGSIFQLLSAAAQDLLGWVDRNQERIQQFGRTIVDALGKAFTDTVLPALREFGRMAEQYLSSPQFQTDLKVWGDRIWTIGSAFASLVGWIATAADKMGQLYTTIKPVLDAYTKIQSFNPLSLQNQASMVGNILNLLGGQKRAIGGVVGPSEGMTWVGEHGPEPVILPQGSRVIPTSEARSLLSGGGGNGATITIGTVINNTTADWNGFAADLAWRSR